MLNKIRIAVLTTNHNNIATKFYLDSFKLSNHFDIEFFNSINDKALDNFSFIAIPPYKEDYKFLSKLRIKKYKIVFLDPRSSEQFKQIKQDEIVIIDSVEQYDFATKVTKNIFSYYEFPIFKLWDWEINKKKAEKKNINLFYHGNKVHLLSSKSTMIRAINVLEQKYSIHLHACYNVKDLGKLNLKVKNITFHQWHDGIYEELRSYMDIGLCPAFIPLRFNKLTHIINYKKNLLTVNDDYIHRFKLPSNPGRIISLIMMGLPVIADMYPSACQILEHGEQGNGFLVSSVGGWINAISKYIENPLLRKEHSIKLIELFKKKYSFANQNTKLYKFLKNHCN